MVAADGGGLALAIPDIQKRFLGSLLVMGDVDAAARAVGLSPDAAETLLAEDGNLQEFLLAAVRGQRGTDAARARATLLQLMRGAKSETVRVNAARLLMEYAVGRPVERKAVAHEHKITDPDQILTRIHNVAKDLGITVNLPGSAPPASRASPVVIDVPYVPVLPEKVPELKARRLGKRKDAGKRKAAANRKKTRKAKSAK